MKKVILLVLALVILSGCAQKNELMQLKINGENYDFSEDIRQSIKIPVQNVSEIYSMLKNQNIVIAFNGSSGKDNGYFAVAAYNLVFKMSKYRAQEGMPANFSSAVFENLTVQKDDTVIIFKGPNTGASENSVSLAGNIIVVQGMTYKNITLASDRLSLLMLGIWTEKDIGKSL